jgi:hypothetical protein
VAVRIEFFTIAGTVDFELVGPGALAAAVSAFDAGTDPGDAAGAVRCVGWLSASDDDEDDFYAWGHEVDDELGIGLLHQGLAEDSGLSTTAVDAGDGDGDGDLATAWTTALRAAVAAAAGGRFGWRTDFDVSGTTGTPDDYPTATSSPAPS